MKFPFLGTSYIMTNIKICPGWQIVGDGCDKIAGLSEQNQVIQLKIGLTHSIGLDTVGYYNTQGVMQKISII